MEFEKIYGWFSWNLKNSLKIFEEKKILKNIKKEINYMFLTSYLKFVKDYTEKVLKQLLKKREGDRFLWNSLFLSF